MEKKYALEAIMTVARKRDMSIKGRACADGRKQQGKIKSEDAAIPKVTLDSILITAAIKAHKGREVAVVDLRAKRGTLPHQ